MTDDKHDPTELLARARRSWSPGDADARRVRRAIGAALVGGPTAGEETAPAGPQASTPATAWGSRFLLAGVIAAASGSAGYLAGYRAGLSEVRRTAPVVASAPSRVAAVSPAAPSGVPEMPPAMPARGLSRHDPHGNRHGAEPRTQSQTESLTVEIRELRNAERALRDGNPGLALAFLQELDRQVPNGQLAEERDATATIARCARGDHPFGVDLGEEFTARYPSSVYRARVEQACRATDPALLGDSPVRRSEK